MTALAPPRLRPFHLDHPHGHQTLSGFAARIAATDAAEPWPLEVIVATGNGRARCLRYTREGRKMPGAESHLDLIDAPAPPAPVVGFVVVRPAEPRTYGGPEWEIADTRVFANTRDAEPVATEVGGAVLPAGTVVREE